MVVFTVLAIGRELFHEVDAPWILYPYGSAGISPAIILGGSLYITNLMAAEGFATPLTSMMGLSIVCAIVCAVVMVIMLYFDLKKYERKGEGFFPSGAEIMKVQIGNTRPDNELPNLVVAFICLFAPVVSILLFDLEPVLGLLIGTVLCVVLNLKKFDNILRSLSAEMGHRLTTLSVFTYMVPHNSGPVNAITLSKINFPKAAWIYFKTAAIPGFCAMAVALIALRLGIVS